MEKRDFDNIAKELPRRPGIYQYLDEHQDVLYVGKALSLKDRVSSYFQKDVSIKTQEMLKNAVSVRWIETGSDFEALLLEANLIKKHRPKYNVTFRDDKSYLYIFISTAEEFPKIFLTRRPNNMPQSEGSKGTFNGLKGEYFGPFPSSKTTKSVLKWLRRAFPFCTQTRLKSRPCFYSHIGQCKPCPSFIVTQPEPLYSQLKKRYRNNIFHIRRILEGNIQGVRDELQQEMKKLSQAERFEEAQDVHTQLTRFEWILKSPATTASFLENPNFYFDQQKKATDELVSFLQSHQVPITDARRIECFDISTFQGNFSVASQVVFIDGVPEKNFYRRYRIRNDGKPNDFAMLTEAIGRRLKHPEWELPSLLVVDGGKGQVSTIQKLFAQRAITLPLIGLAKQFERLIIPEDGKLFEVSLPRKHEGLKLIQVLRDEAHRFALSYHRLRRNKDSLQAK